MLQSLFSNAQSYLSITSLDEKSALRFGFRKLIVVPTEHGRILALDSLHNGSVVWATSVTEGINVAVLHDSVCVVWSVSIIVAVLRIAVQDLHPKLVGDGGRPWSASCCGPSPWALRIGEHLWIGFCASCVYGRTSLHSL